MATPRITTGTLGSAVGFLKARLKCKAVKLEVIDSSNAQVMIPETAFRANLPIKPENRVVINIVLKDARQVDAKVLQELTRGMTIKKDFSFDRANNELTFKSHSAIKTLGKQAKSFLLADDRELFP